MLAWKIKFKVDLGNISKQNKKDHGVIENNKTEQKFTFSFSS